MATLGGPGVAGKETGMQLTTDNTDKAHTAYRFRFTAVAAGTSFSKSGAGKASLSVKMDGTEICDNVFTEPFDLDICGDDGKLEAR